MTRPLIPGEVVAAGGTIELNPGRERRRLVVENTGDRPVQVGSHFHFFEVNRALRFDRARAFWVAAPGRGEIRDETLLPPADGEVVVRALFSGVSRGTEALVFQGRVPASERERMRAPRRGDPFGDRLLSRERFTQRRPLPHRDTDGDVHDEREPRERDEHRVAHAARSAVIASSREPSAQSKSRQN